MIIYKFADIIYYNIYKRFKSTEMSNGKYFVFKELLAMADEAKKKKWRMHLLDELRGLAVVCMIFYHAFYLIGEILQIEWGKILCNFFTPAEPYFASLFIFLSGIACNLSRSNVERGVKLGIVALGITLATYLYDPNYIITFGVLHMLAVCMILYGLVSKYLRVIPVWLGILLNILLFIFLYSTSLGKFGIPYLKMWDFPQEWYTTNYLFMFGFPNETFSSADYFPLLPWMFMFFAGGFFGRLIRMKKFPKWTAKKHIPPLAFVRRHALLFYVAHQPVIYGICIAVQWFMSLFNPAEKK